MSRDIYAYHDTAMKYVSRQEDKAFQLVEENKKLIQTAQKATDLITEILQNQDDNGYDFSDHPDKLELFAWAKKHNLWTKETKKFSKEEIKDLTETCKSYREICLKKGQNASGKVPSIMNKIQTMYDVMKSVFDNQKKFNEYILRKTGNG